MKASLKRVLTIAAILSTVAALFATNTASLGANEGDDRTYRVTITNDTDAQWFTPPNVAAHGNTRVFQTGRQATPGVQAVAENGQVPVLQAEWADAGLDSFVGNNEEEQGPIPPGASRTFEITTDQDRYSVVTMIICTNDGFGGVNSQRLPVRIGQTFTDNLRAYDAGTELNTQLDADFVPAPFCGDPAAGTCLTNPDLAQDGVIRAHRGILPGVGDIPQMYDFDRFVGQITIERIG